MQVAVASVDASITGVAVELRHLSLCRSTAAAPLLSCLLGGPAATPTEQRQRALAAAEAAAASGGSSSWVEVVTLEADDQQASPAAAPHLTQRARLAVSVHYFDQAAAPGTPGAGSGAPPAPGQLHCSVAVGRLLLAHAPGFATSLVLFAGQYSAVSSVSPFVGGLPRGRLPGASSASLRSSRAASPAKPASAASLPTSPGAAAAAAAPLEGDAAGQAGEGRSLLAQTLQPKLALECRIAQLELAALASQAPDAAAAVLLLRQAELHRCAAGGAQAAAAASPGAMRNSTCAAVRWPPCSGSLSWGAPWNSHLRHALLAPPAGGASMHPGRLCLLASCSMLDACCT